MNKKNDYRKGNSQNSSYKRGSQKQDEFNRNKVKTRKSYSRTGNKRNVSTKSSSLNNNYQRYNRKVQSNETINDIKIDISRIEKEIELEIKEIKSLKL